MACACTGHATSSQQSMCTYILPWPRGKSICAQLCSLSWPSLSMHRPCHQQPAKHVHIYSALATRQVYMCTAVVPLLALIEHAQAMPPAASKASAHIFCPAHEASLYVHSCGPSPGLHCACTGHATSSQQSMCTYILPCPRGKSICAQLCSLSWPSLSMHRPCHQQPAKHVHIYSALPTRQVYMCTAVLPLLAFIEHAQAMPPAASKACAHIFCPAHEASLYVHSCAPSPGPQ